MAQVDGLVWGEMSVMWREKDAPPCGCGDEKLRAGEKQVDGDKGNIDPSVPGPFRPIFANKVSKSFGPKELSQSVLAVYTAQDVDARAATDDHADHGSQSNVLSPP